MPPSAHWSPLHTQLHRTLRQRQLLLKGQALLVAVSGGQDSLCLLRLLLDLQPKWQWRLVVGHCNHRWRADADANAGHVQTLAASWGLPFASAIYAPDQPDQLDQGIASEAAARTWRYQALADMALQQDCAVVVTGHTASDRAETLLYNLMRGSGTDGLQALVWQRPLTATVQLVRPLLEMTRAETSGFCQQAHLPVWEDSTNQNLQYARNRIRQVLLPQLKAEFNPQVEQALAQTAELLRADVEYLETMAATLWQQGFEAIQVEHHPLQYRLNRAMLRTAPLALQRRVIRLALKQMLPRSPTFEQIEKCLALLTAPNRSQTDPFPGGTIAQVNGDWIQFTLNLRS